MSTAQTQSAIQPPAYGANQCMDQSDLDAFLNFNEMASPSVEKGKGRITTQTPTLASPSTSLQYFDLPEEQHTPLQPSHDYAQYKQQIGLPPQPQSVFASYNSGNFEGQMFENGNSSNMMSAGSDLDSFFNFSQGEDIVDPSFLLREEAQAPVRYYPGMHQQQAELAKQMMLKQKQREAAEQQRSETSRRSTSQQPMDNLREDTISRVMSEMRRNSSISDAMSPPPGSALPHIVKIKKDEDDMDEDERLLNSEEGKKLSSKERRQLRNKVSARAFRSRRKEYISQLEAQIAAKSNEANAFKRENQLLKADNDSLRHLAEKLISHPAFMPFVNELSRDPQMAESLARVANPPPTSQQSTSKDVSQFSQQFSQSNSDVIVGMTLIPEVPVDLSSLNIGSNQWQQLPQGIEAYSNPQVFAVTEVTPTAEPLDIAALSGKEPTENVIAQFMEAEEEKPSFPEISLPVKEAAVEEVCENVFDENDPNETLFAISKPTSTKRDEQDQEPIFGTLPTEKAFARFEIVVTSEVDEEVFGSQLELKFARLEASFRNLETLTSRYRC